MLSQPHPEVSLSKRNTRSPSRPPPPAIHCILHTCKVAPSASHIATHRLLSLGLTELTIDRATADDGAPELGEGALGLLEGVVVDEAEAGLRQQLRDRTADTLELLKELGLRERAGISQNN